MLLTLSLSCPVCPLSGVESKILEGSMLNFWVSLQSTNTNIAAKSNLTLCNPMDSSTLGFPVLHHLPKFVQTHVHRVDDAIQFCLCISSLEHQIHLQIIANL